MPNVAAPYVVEIIGMLVMTLSIILLTKNLKTRFRKKQLDKKSCEPQKVQEFEQIPQTENVVEKPNTEEDNIE